jgi:hypothetical protein
MVDALAAVVTANHSAGGTEPNPPPPPAPFIALEPRSAWDWDWRARVRAWSDRLGPQPAWQLFAALVSEHFDEVQRLVNANKRVGAVWHRHGGPALVRHLMALPPETMVPIPTAIQGHRPADLLSRLFKLFERFGSPALRSDTARFGGFAQALPGASIADLDRLVAETGAA